MSKVHKITVRQATIQDLPKIAKIHSEAFPGFFLTTLGIQFLVVMYKAFLMNPSSIFLIHENESDDLNGFAVGAMQSENNDRKMALRMLPQFIWAVLPALFSHPIVVFKKLTARFFQTGEAPFIPSDVAVLRSIGVQPVARGGGLASSLLVSFEEVSKKRGAKQVYLTTDADNNERAQRFYEKNGYVFVEAYRQDSDRQMWSMSKVL